MSWLSLTISFLGGLGLGSVVTAVIQHWLARRAKTDDLLIDGRQEAFRGIFESLEELELGWTEKKAKRLGFWISRIELLASQDTINAVHRWRDSQPETHERKQRQSQMINAMRRDLKLP